MAIASMTHVRIAFQYGAVHERAGVALVGVAADVFLIRLRSGGKFPLHAGGEAARRRGRAGRI